MLVDGTTPLQGEEYLALNHGQPCRPFGFFKMYIDISVYCGVIEKSTWT